METLLFRNLISPSEDMLTASSSLTAKTILSTYPVIEVTPIFAACLKNVSLSKVVFPKSDISPDMPCVLDVFFSKECLPKKIFFNVGFLSRLLVSVIYATFFPVTGSIVSIGSLSVMATPYTILPTLDCSS